MTQFTERRRAAGDHSATTSISICPMPGVHLRPEEGAPTGATDDRPSGERQALGWAPNAWRPLRRSSGLPDDLDTHEHPVLIEIKIHIGAFILPNQVEQSNAL